MAQSDLQIQIKPGLVRVRYEVTKDWPHGRFYAAIALFVMTIVLAGFLLFSPGKHGTPSMWHDICRYPGASWITSFPVLLLTSFTVALSWYVTRYVRYAYPADQEMVCERGTITISWIPWLDWSNTRWEHRSYPLSYVSQIRYGYVARGKGGGVRGLRFVASGTQYRLFPSLTQAEADQILHALERLGAKTNRAN